MECRCQGHTHAEQRRDAQTYKKFNKLPADEEGQTPDKKALVVCFGELLIDFLPTESGVSLAKASAFRKERLLMLPKITLTTLASVLTHMQGLHWLFVTLTAEGERGFMFFRNPSAEMLLCEAELDVNLIEKASILLKPRRSAHIAAMEMAKTSGCILSYDPNARLLPWPSAEAARGGIISIWDEADMIKISEEELTLLIEGCDASDDNVVLEKLFHSNLKLLLVTEGSNGCKYYTQEFKGHVGGGVLRAKGAVPALLTEAEVLRMLPKAVSQEEIDS
ncbi:hypothetical protein WN943_017735 [Citrus x changshan-huyou]